MNFNLCLRCNVDNIEEARVITDAIKAGMANHPEAAMTATINARLEPQEIKQNATDNHPTKKGVRPYGS